MSLHPKSMRMKDMSVSAIGSSPPAPPPQVAARAHDGDSDDKGGGSTAAPVQAALAPGTGTAVNKTA